MSSTFQHPSSGAKRLVTVWIGLAALAVVCTTIFGSIHYFSPIPYEDQWDGYIGFFHTLADGQHAAWWTPQMEHRIIFSRLLFWIDGRMFGGLNIFCIVSTFVLMIGLCALLACEGIAACRDRDDAASIVLLIFGLMFSWVQFENFTSGFQNQFVAVYLFSFLAFSQYSRASSRPARLALAFICAILSALSMANGLGVLFVMSAQAILLRRPIREAIWLAVTGTVVGVMYLHGQVIPVLDVAPAMAHVHLAQLKFFFIFLGGPTTYLGATYPIAGTMGLLTFAVFASVTARLFMKRLVTPYRSFLIAGYGFVVASGIGASHGRWMLGFEAAHASRYATPALLGYVLLTMLLVDVVKTKKTVVLATAAVLLTWLLPFQQIAVGKTDHMPAFKSDMYNWKLAVLGQKIGLDHPEFDKSIFPESAHDRYVNQANFAAAMNIGPYKYGWLHDAGIVKYDQSLRDDALCLGTLDRVGVDGIGQTATGWLIVKRYQQSSTLVVLANPDNETVGYGVTGIKRPDVATQPHATSDAGWFGFAKPNNPHLTAYAYVGGKFCLLN